MTDLVSQAQFARLENVDRSTVTRWKEQGRLVMIGEGRKAKVDVKASRKRIKETNGGRDDVTARHNSGKKQGEPDTTPEELKARETRAGAQAAKWPERARERSRQATGLTGG